MNELINNVYLKFLDLKYWKQNKNSGKNAWKKS
jgi:hypothetical protein